MTNHPSRYSAPWQGQDGKQWREVAHWVGNGWRTFLQWQDARGDWQGY